MPNVLLSLMVLKTHQLDVVRYFYKTIGIDLTEEQHGSGPVHFAGKLGTTVLEIYPLEDGEADSTTRLGFVVEDLGYVIESLWRRKLSPLKKAKLTEWGLRIVVKDPDGRPVELYQRGDSSSPLKRLKLMADYGQTVLWHDGGDCVGPVNLDELPLSVGLRTAMEMWAQKFDDTLNHEYPPESGFANDEETTDFEAEGMRIWKELRGELGPDYSVVYFSVSDQRLHEEP